MLAAGQLLFAFSFLQEDDKRIVHHDKARTQAQGNLVPGRMKKGSGVALIGRNPQFFKGRPFMIEGQSYLKQGHNQDGTCAFSQCHVRM